MIAKDIAPKPIGDHGQQYGNYCDWGINHEKQLIGLVYESVTAT
jgi:hypothetical protein